jgi:5-methylcytosine-specific restriction endonuclease McrA
MRALVLNSDYSFMNISSSFVVFCHSLEGKNIILKSYENKYFRSQYLKINQPSVAISSVYKNIRKKKRGVSLNTRNILLRDFFRCGFCGCELNATNGTKDHIIPLSKGGGNTWNNLVAACRDCNNLKADKLLSEANMRLLIKPREINNSEKLEILIKNATKLERTNWLDFLEENNLKLF